MHGDRQIVLSSDAHAPADVGFSYEASIALAREAGYEELATFERRTRTMKRLG